MSKISMEINLRKMSLLERDIKEIDFTEESDREKVLSALHQFCNEHSVLSQTLRVDPVTDVKGLVGQAVELVDKVFPPASAKSKSSTSTQKKKQPKEEQKSIDERFADLDVEFDDGDFI